MTSDGPYQDFVADGGLNSQVRTVTKEDRLCRRRWNNEVPGDYRFVVEKVTPNGDMLYFGTVVPSAHQTVSKKQFDQEGEEASRFTGAGTGAWAFAGEEPGQNWSFDAVLDHYRKTPEFAKLVMWSRPEEAPRVARFPARQTGQLPDGPRFQRGHGSDGRHQVHVVVQRRHRTSEVSGATSTWEWWMPITPRDGPETAKCLVEKVGASRSRPTPIPGLCGVGAGTSRSATPYRLQSTASSSMRRSWAARAELNPSGCGRIRYPIWSPISGPSSSIPSGPSSFW